MSLQNFLMAAKKGDLQKLQQELEADPSVINAQLTEGLLGGHTAIEFAAFELRIDAVNYLLSNGARFNEDISNIITHLISRCTILNYEIARINLFSVMLNNGVNISNFQHQYPGVNNFLDLVSVLRQTSNNLEHYRHLSNSEFINDLFEEEEGNTDESSGYSTEFTSLSDSYHSEANSTSSEEYGVNTPGHNLMGAFYSGNADL